MKKKLVGLLGVMVLTLAACGNKEGSNDAVNEGGTAVTAESGAAAATSGGEAEPGNEGAYISKGTPEEVLSEENMRAYATAMGGIPLTDECLVPVENTSEWEMEGITEHDDYYSEHASFTAEFMPGVTGYYRYSGYAQKDGKECEINEVSGGYIHNAYEDDITIDSAVVCGEYVGKFDYLPFDDTESAIDLGEIKINITKAEMPESVFDPQIEGTMTVTAPDGTVYEESITGSVGYQYCCLYLDPVDSEFDFGRGTTYLDISLVYDFENGVFNSSYDFGDVITNLKKQ